MGKGLRTANCLVARLDERRTCALLFLSFPSRLSSVVALSPGFQNDLCTRACGLQFPGFLNVVQRKRV